MRTDLEIFNCEQGSEEWHQARAGIITASELSKVMAEGRDEKTGKKDPRASLTRAKYMRTLAGEIITGKPNMEGYKNSAMDRGHELEAEARSAYSLITGREVDEVGFCRWKRVGASPDGLERHEPRWVRGLEIKTKIPSLMLELYGKKEVPAEHKPQVQGSLWITGLPSWIFVAYWPGMKLFEVEVLPDLEYHEKIEKAVTQFQAELDEMLAWYEAV